jgi:hypothetical protein
MNTKISIFHDLQQVYLSVNELAQSMALNSGNDNYRI